MIKTVIVVGNSFKESCDNINSISEDQLFEILLNNHEQHQKYKFIAGQGLSHTRISQHLINNISDKQQYDLSDFFNISSHKKEIDTHKKSYQNILIHDLNRCIDNDEQYQAKIFVDAENELIIDHQTGLHIQGMVITEACRQMFIAVSEKFLLTKDNDYYFVINKMDINFLNYLFPYPATIHCQILKKEEQRGKWIVKVRLTVIQNNTHCAITDIDYNVNSAKICLRNEKILAKKSLTQFLNS